LEINSGLTFDLDDMTIEDEKVANLLNWLCEEFGTENVWYRISSSGDGLHVMIGELVISNITGIPELNPILLSTDEQMKYRNQVELECRGRRISDSYRKQVGMRTSRIFKTKNGNDSGDWVKWVSN
jgi:hypothetical protein